MEKLRFKKVNRSVLISENDKDIDRNLTYTLLTTGFTFLKENDFNEYSDIEYLTTCIYDRYKIEYYYELVSTKFTEYFNLINLSLHCGISHKTLLTSYFVPNQLIGKYNNKFILENESKFSKIEPLHPKTIICFCNQLLIINSLIDDEIILKSKLEYQQCLNASHELLHQLNKVFNFNYWDKDNLLFKIVCKIGLKLKKLIQNCLVFINCPNENITKEKTKKITWIKKDLKQVNEIKKIVSSNEYFKTLNLTRVKPFTTVILFAFLKELFENEVISEPLTGASMINFIEEEFKIKISDKHNAKRTKEDLIASMNPEIKTEFNNLIISTNAFF